MMIAYDVEDEVHVLAHVDGTAQTETLTVLPAPGGREAALAAANFRRTGAWQEREPVEGTRVVLAGAEQWWSSECVLPAAAVERTVPPPSARDEPAAGERPRRGTVVCQRPGDDVWGVTTVEISGRPRARKTVCGGEIPCPWRRDAPPGQFPAEVFRISAPTSYDQGTRGFACHGHEAKNPYLCAGWLLRGASDNLMVRRYMADRTLLPPTLTPGMELYDSYRAMAIANGVASDDPVLAPCRGEGVLWGTGADGLVPLDVSRSALEREDAALAPSGVGEGSSD
ncbi:DUF6283 family protein [Streptomyces sp. MP131-18]|uniref:DUF6283 family protein n=1 Tax=Streptomyces sp. MP131-18 TaxID=1857892 RepID=UPI00097BCF50|nr:DUF6283 family protein [Streptomyces sp. MP131-18]ONK13239.1 hypothetical protein STBA_40020 [Streptomyces sp. MP131-18]